MKSGRLLIAAVCLAVLAGLVYWSKKHKEAEASKPAADAAPKILTLDEAQVDEIRIQKTGVDPMVLDKLGGKWEIVKPEPMPADQDTVKLIVSTASALTSDELIDGKPSSLGPFGLAAPGIQVTLKLKNGKTSTVDIGNDTPAGGSTYVKLAGDPRVFTIASYSKGNIDKALNDLRDKRLLTFDSDKLSRVELTAKGPSVEFGKTAQNDWQILKPEPMRADGLQVDELVRKLREAKMNLESGQVAVATFNAAPRIATVSVTDAGGAQTLEVRQDKDKTTYAKSSVVNGIYKTAPDLADAVNKAVADFRSKKLFDFGFSELSQLTVQGVTYSHHNDKWFLNGKEMDSSSVLNLVDKLRDLSATGFSTKGGGASIFEASVSTQDKKRNEKVIISREGSNTFARREGEPAIYTMDGGTADDLVKAATDIKPAAPAKAAAKK